MDNLPSKVNSKVEKKSSEFHEVTKIKEKLIGDCLYVCDLLTEKSIERTNDILEEILKEMRRVKNNLIGIALSIESLHGEVQHKEKVGPTNSNMMVSAAHASEAPTILVEFPKGGERILLGKLEAFKNRLRVPSDGKSFLELPISQLHMNWPPSVFVLIGQTFEISLANYSKFELSGEDEGSVGSKFKEISEYKTTLSPFSSLRTCKKCLIYKVGDSNVYLGLSYEFVMSDKDRSDKEEHFYGLGIVNMKKMNALVMEEQLDKAADNLSRKEFGALRYQRTKEDHEVSDIKGNKIKDPIMVFNGNMAAIGKLSPLGDNFLLEIDFMGDVPDFHPKPGTSEPRTIGNSYTVNEIKILQSENHLSDKYECLIELVNELPVKLVDFSSLIHPSHDCILPPREVPAFTREMFLISNLKEVMGIFSYLIPNTDLQFEVVVRFGKDKQSFVLAWSKRRVAFDDLTESNLEWNPQPFVCGNAGGDLQEIVHGNLRLTGVMMSSGKKSKLTIVVQTFN